MTISVTWGRPDEEDGALWYMSKSRPPFRRKPPADGGQFKNATPTLSPRIRRRIENFTDEAPRVPTPRYGLANNGYPTFTEIGRELGVARQTVQQDFERALEKLRPLFESLGYDTAA